MGCTGMQGDCNRAIAEHEVLFDTDLLFLLDAFQLLSACGVHSVVNEAALKLQHAIAVLATVHPQVWLRVALQFPWPVFEPFFVCFSHSLMPVLPQFDLQLLVALLPLREYDDPGLIFCEALFEFTKAD